MIDLFKFCILYAAYIYSSDAKNLISLTDVCYRIDAGIMRVKGFSAKIVLRQRLHKNARHCKMMIIVEFQCVALVPRLKF